MRGGGSFRCGNKAQFSVCRSTYARMALFSQCGSSDDPMYEKRVLSHTNHA